VSARARRWVGSQAIAHLQELSSGSSLVSTSWFWTALAAKRPRDALTFLAQGASYRTIVVGKRFNSGKYAFRYLEVEPWNGGVATGELEVRRKLYQAVELGDSEPIRVGPGLLHFLWYYAKRDPQPSPQASLPAESLIPRRASRQSL